MREYNFSGEIIYKWEIGPDYITLYDDENSYRKNGCHNILDFFSTHFNMYIEENSRFYVYQPCQKCQRCSFRERQYLDDNDLERYNVNCKVVNSHYSNAYKESYYHSFSCCTFFVGRPLHMHIRYNKKITIQEINHVIEALAEYLNKDVDVLKQQYQSILNDYSQNESSKLLIAEDNFHEKNSWRRMFCC